VDRVVDRDGLASEQQRRVQLVLHDRLRAQTLGIGDLGRSPRAAPLHERESPCDQGDDQERRHAGQQPAKPTIRPALSLDLPLAHLAARAQELALELVELQRVFGRPVERRGQARSAVQLAGILPASRPSARRLDEVRVQDPSRSVLVEPFPQARPLAQESLVGDLDHAIGDREQPAVGEHLHDVRCLGVPLGVELGQRHTPAHHGLVLAGRRQTQQDRAGERLLLGAEPAEHRLGQARHRTANAARRQVRIEGDRAPLASLPELEQRGREQRQCTRLVAHFGDEGSVRAGSTCTPTRRAGCSIARRYSSPVIGPTSTWLAPSRRESSG
jgi:hypothetical protein